MSCGVSRLWKCRMPAHNVTISGAIQPHLTLLRYDGGVNRRRSRGCGSPSMVRPSSATGWVEWRDVGSVAVPESLSGASVVVATSAMVGECPVPPCDDAD